MLSPLTDDVWTVPHHFSAPALRIPLRMTVLRLGDGGLLLYSPVPLEGELPDQLAELGEVQHIVAPSRFHHLHAASAAALFPAAKLWGAVGLAKKRPDLQLEELPDASPWPGVELVRIEGAPLLNAVCLHHVAASTTVVCDLVFNMQDVRGWFGQLFTWMTGTNDGLAQSRSWRMFSRERAATVASIDRLLGFGAERVTFGHGDPLSERGAERLREVMLLR